MATFCVMVKGPCRGKMCDFWARVRLRKSNIERLTQELREGISICREKNGTDLDYAFVNYWTDFGIKDIQRFKDEEPELSIKMKQVENQVRRLLFEEKKERGQKENLLPL